MRMRRHKANPKYNVISIRITDEEREALKSRSNSTNRTISDLMREALQKITPPAVTSYTTGEKTI